jgi:hypothetical protein
MFVLVVCSLWACASSPIETFYSIKPCEALAIQYTKSLPLDADFSVVCLTKEQYDATTKI